MSRFKNGFPFALKFLDCWVQSAALTHERSPPFYAITIWEKLSLEFFSPSIKDGGLQVYDYFSYCRIAPSQQPRPHPLPPRLLRFLAPGASFGHSGEKKKKSCDEIVENWEGWKDGKSTGGLMQQLSFTLKLSSPYLKKKKKWWYPVIKQ